MEQLRSRIYENFSEQDMRILLNICTSTKIADNNMKVKLLIKYLEPKGFDAIGSGTNRFTMFKDGYAFKFALDHYGYDDNETEFNMSKRLFPFGATKTYETNGLVNVSEFVNVMNKSIFVKNKKRIRSILRSLSRWFLFADLGTVARNYKNWGFDNYGEIRFLDYGYVFERDDMLMRCNKCRSRIEFDFQYDKMACQSCGKEFSVHDIVALMKADSNYIKRWFTPIKPATITVDANFGKAEYSTPIKFRSSQRSD